MNEIYSNDLNVIEIYTSVRGKPTAPEATPTAKLYVGASRDISTGTPTDLTVVQLESESLPLVGRYQAIVPHQLLQRNQYAKIDISFELEGFGVINKSEVYEISQRLVEYEDLNVYLGYDVTGDSYDMSYEDYDKLEKIVRKVIESYCGQKFNCWQGTRKVYAARDYIPLPQHLEKLTSISSFENLTPINIDSSESVYQIEDTGLSLDRTTDFVTPHFFIPRSKNNVTHHITGLWGYEGIPAEVTQAAFEVIVIFNMDDIDNRRKFLSYISNDASINMNFNWTSYWDSTGNPIADDLLDAFRIYNLSAV